MDKPLKYRIFVTASLIGVLSFFEPAYNSVQTFLDKFFFDRIIKQELAEKEVLFIDTNKNGKYDLLKIPSEDEEEIIYRTLKELTGKSELSKEQIVQKYGPLERALFITEK